MLMSISGEKKVKQAVRNNIQIISKREICFSYPEKIEFYFFKKGVRSWLIKRAVTIRELKDITA